MKDYDKELNMDDAKEESMVSDLEKKTIKKYLYTKTKKTLGLYHL